MIKSTLIFLVLYFTAIYGYERKGYPGYEYDTEVEGWFKLHSKPTDWKTAKATCEAEEDSESEETNDDIKEDPEDLEQPGQNKIVDQELCIIMNAKNGSKSRVDCNQQHPFICFAPMEHPPDCDFSGNKPGNDREGWPGYLNCKDGWVKVHPGPGDFDEAKETCEKEGGKIIDLSDPKQKEIALLVLAGNISADITKIYHKTRKEYPNGGFTEVDGKNKWVKNLRPHCTLLYKNGTQDDKGLCNSTAAFICYVKHPVDSCDGGPPREGHPDYKSCKKVDGWVKVHPGPSDFKEAEDTCAKEGGSILDFNIPEQKLIALELIANKSTAENTVVIFGKYKIFLQGVEDDAGFANFEKNEQFCSLLHGDGTIEHEVDCNAKKSFICYVPYTVTYDCEAPNYIVDNSTGNCYKLHTAAGKTWNKSREHCQGEGGDLAVITSYMESLQLKDIWEKHDDFYEVYFPLEMFVGIEEKTIGSWKTIDDKTLDEAGYEIWADGKPDEKLSETPVEVKGVRKTCGCINMEAKYLNCWCDLVHGFMCKKKATMYKLGVKVEA